MITKIQELLLRAGIATLGFPVTLFERAQLSLQHPMGYLETASNSSDTGKAMLSTYIRYHQPIQPYFKFTQPQFSTSHTLTRNLSLALAISASVQSSQITTWHVEICRESSWPCGCDLPVKESIRCQFKCI